LQTLTEEQRIVVVYRCALGYATTEVAQLLGKPENAVRGLQFRALASLSRHLAAAERRQTEQGGEKGNRKGKGRRSHGSTR
jgi:DNA-directed RNA polymerase specialized sigma24 family protein